MDNIFSTKKCRSLLLKHCKAIRSLYLDHIQDEIRVAYHVHSIRYILDAYRPCADDMDVIFIDHLRDICASCETLDGEVIINLYNNIQSFALALN